MSETKTEEISQLEHFPISFFAMIMGLTGLTLGWRKASEALEWSMTVGHILACLALFAFVILAIIYLVKAMKYPDAIKAELKHPIKLSFFPAMSISLILLSVCFLPMSPAFAQMLWMVGIVLHLGLMLFVLTSWVNHDHFQVGHLNPSWFIPAVGNVLVPITGIPLGFVEISWFYFSIGMIFWIILLVIVFNRVLFHDPLPAKLLPTMFILIAPPAVGFVAYIKLVGDLDSFARILYYIGLFFTLFLVVQAPRFARLPFFLSWWAYSFPMAAITVATFVMHEKTGIQGFEYLAFVLLAMLTSIILMLLVKTTRAIMGKEICVPE
jgi:tellurite resistance protein